jgi:hypothetical protein
MGMSVEMSLLFAPKDGAILKQTWRLFGRIIQILNSQRKEYKKEKKQQN